MAAAGADLALTPEREQVALWEARRHVWLCGSAWAGEPADVEQEARVAALVLPDLDLPLLRIAVRRDLVDLRRSRLHLRFGGEVDPDIAFAFWAWGPGATTADALDALLIAEEIGERDGERGPGTLEAVVACRHCAARGADRWASRHGVCFGCGLRPLDSAA